MLMTVMKLCENRTWPKISAVRYILLNLYKKEHFKPFQKCFIRTESGYRILVDDDEFFKAVEECKKCKAKNREARRQKLLEKKLP